MDQKFWLKFKIKKFKNTTKMMFGQYAYKIQLQSRGASGLKNNEYIKNLGTITSYLAQRMKYGEWSSSKLLTPKEMLAIAEIYKEMLDQDKVLMRIEEPFASFYFKTEDDAKQFATKIPKTVSITLFQFPGSDTELEALKANKIIKKQPMENYTYCVTLKPGTYADSDKEVILNLIENLGAKVSYGFVSLLRSPTIRVHNAYKIYIKTEADYTWMALAINSRLLGKINQLHFTNK